MTQILGKDIQKYLLDAAKCLDAFCREHNITYYLSGGTLLGAVRHQGFIPWDDDIDIMMPRCEYDRLILAFTDERYKIVSCEKDRHHGAPYARLWDSMTIRDWGELNHIEMGIYIDILPIDGYPDSLLLSNLRNRRLKFLRKCREFMLHKHSRDNSRLKGIKEAARRLSPFSANYFSRRINKIGRKKSFEKSRYVGVQSGTYHQERERNSKMVFDKTVYLPFEDTVFPAPSGYDEYLRNLFGDYMQLPPEEQRVGRHAQNIYLKEN